MSFRWDKPGVYSAVANQLPLEILNLHSVGTKDFTFTTVPCSFVLGLVRLLERDSYLPKMSSERSHDTKFNQITTSREQIDYSQKTAIQVLSPSSSSVNNVKAMH